MPKPIEDMVNIILQYVTLLFQGIWFIALCCDDSISVKKIQ